ncbi:hypothetical protein BX600DRAFT_437777 [Xylariales sp. PMI_506]|nr:hypothetical protein BX600DRAFT_437777 [Xylariales sp. PMI_506]
MADQKHPEGPPDTLHVEEPLPAYEPYEEPAEAGPSSSTTARGSQPAELPAEPPYGEPPQPGGKGPTVSSPFNFPEDTPAPSYFEAAAQIQRPIAVPQVEPVLTSPFLPAYSPSMLSYGITPETWANFLNTLSAFLSATVSERAVSHAGDLARQIGKGAGGFGKNVMQHAKSVGQNITDHAKKGNILGAAFAVVGGAISLPISAAANTVGATVTLPGSAMAAVSRKPQTPQERAIAYITVANRDWFHPRGVHAQLLDTRGLSALVGAPPPGSGSPGGLLEVALAGKQADAEAQIQALGTYIAGLEIKEQPQPQQQPPQLGPQKLKLGEKTLWLVITKEQGERAVAEAARAAEKEKQRARREGRDDDFNAQYRRDRRRDRKF